MHTEKAVRQSKMPSDRTIESYLIAFWQVEKRGGAGKLSAEERKQLDIEYAKHYSPWMDLRIILKTFLAFVQKEDV